MTDTTTPNHTRRWAIGLAAILVGLVSQTAGGSAALASASLSARAVITDPAGDVTLIDGLPTDPRSQSIDIRRATFEKLDNKLKVTTTIKRGRTEGTMNQYMVATVTVPSTGLKFLIQASTNTTQGYVAKQSWANEVFCPNAQSKTSGASLTAIVPLKCLDRPARLENLTSYTLVEVYDPGLGQNLDLAEDFASGPAILRLR